MTLGLFPADWRVDAGDCRDVLATLPENGFDACVTDPPYEIRFLGASWDGSGVAFDPKTWAAVLRVLKPGSPLVAFGGTRTYHRMVCAIEDAGFQIRDSIHWMYGQGWPKAKSQLKPGHEPIVLARKPGETRALNVDACRVATDWNEPDRPESWKQSGKSDKPGESSMFGSGGTGIGCHPGGRWPANVVLVHSATCRRVGTKRAKGTPHVSGNTVYEDKGVVSFKRTRSPTCYTDEAGTEQVADFDCGPCCPVRALEDQSVAAGVHGAGKARLGSSTPRPVEYSGVVPIGPTGAGRMHRFGDVGTAARFYTCLEWSKLDDLWPAFLYQAKASTSERERGLGSKKGERRNRHPTVKPIALMRWLCRLVTPAGGLVLDPFAGSGTTGCAAVLEQLRFYGVELDEAYADLARRRIAAAA